MSGRCARSASRSSSSCPSRVLITWKGIEGASKTRKSSGGKNSQAGSVANRPETARPIATAAPAAPAQSVRVQRAVPQNSSRSDLRYSRTNHPGGPPRRASLAGPYSAAPARVAPLARLRQRLRPPHSFLACPSPDTLSTASGDVLFRTSGTRLRPPPAPPSGRLRSLRARGGCRSRARWPRRRGWCPAGPRRARPSRSPPAASCGT